MIFNQESVDNEILVMDGIEIPEHPTTRHKSHIEKVMFVVAMARPQHRPDGSWFDGKIGIWECTERVQAQRASVNRARGTWETKPKSLDAAFYQHLMTKPGGIISKINEKMPWRRVSGINVQHDGAKPHEGVGNRDASGVAGSADGWNIKFITQPVNF